MNLRFPESEILCWANGYTEHQGHKEQELIDLKSEIQKRGYLTKEELYETARWKSHRTADLTKENPDACIKAISEEAFRIADDVEKLKTLTDLRGIGRPTASAILHLFDKRQYPMLNYRAVWSIGMEEETNYSNQFWQEYTAYCREIAERNNVSMRTLDRALWVFSYHKQG